MIQSDFTEPQIFANMSLLNATADYNVCVLFFILFPAHISKAIFAFF